MTARTRLRDVSKMLVAVLLLQNLSGCGPAYTYPADSVPSAVEKICREEFKLEVQARVVGKTLGALLKVPAIIDNDHQPPREVMEQMGKVLSVSTRVALSTDLALDYLVVVARDDKSDNQLVYTRSVDDIRRANADMLGVEESLNRIIQGLEKLERDDPDRQTFVLEDIQHESFLAEQIVQRIRYAYLKESQADGDEVLPQILVDGHFLEKDGKRTFRFSLIALQAGDPDRVILTALRVTAQVLKSYRFEKFDELEIQDYFNRQKLVLTRDVLRRFQDKKMTETELLDGYLEESQSIQEVFKLFGFKQTDEASDAPSESETEPVADSQETNPPPPA